jgi:carbon-monoxide dehydrogenase medium subunit
MHEFDYRRAVSLDEAVGLLTSESDARVLAGGMSLIPTMKHRLSAPLRLVDINALSDLRFIDRQDERLVVGAMTLHETVAESALVRETIPALAMLAGHIGDVQVRHRGTIGGSICNNDPAACYPSALLALDASIKTTKRTIPADNFFVGMFETALTAGEVVTQVEFRIPDAAAYVKFHNMASRFSIVGVFVAKFGSEVRVAITGAGHHVFRERASEERLSRVFSPEAIEDLTVSAEGLIADVHGSPEFRAHLIPVLVRQAVAQCLGADCV